MIRSLLLFPRISAKAIIVSLPDMIIAENEKELHRIYIAECMRMLTENSAVKGGQYMSAKYYDIIHPPEKDNRTAEEMVQDIVNQVGLEVTD